MQNQGAATLLVDRRGKIRMASVRAARRFGARAEDLEGLWLHEVLDSPGRGDLEAALGSAAAGRRALQASLRSPGGKLSRLDLSIEPAGGTSGLMGSLLLVTLGPEEPPGREPRTAGDEGSVAAEPDAVCIMSRGRIIEASASLGRLVGVEAGTLRGWAFRNLVDARDLLPVVEALRAQESAGAAGIELGFRLLRSGDRPPLEVMARARRVLRDARPALIVSIEDISRPTGIIRRAARALARLESALTATHDGVLVLGPGREGWPVQYVSDGFGSLFGVSPSGLTGRPLEEVIARLAPVLGDSVRSWASWTAGLETGATRVDRIDMIGPRPRRIERTAAPLPSDGEGGNGWVLAFRDLTAKDAGTGKRTARVGPDRPPEGPAPPARGAGTPGRGGPGLPDVTAGPMRRDDPAARAEREDLRRLHDEIRLANEGLEHRLRDLRRFNSDLRAVADMRSQLLANVSHELQTPLVSIKGLTEMILTGRLGGINVEQKEGLEMALRNINRLIGLIDNLLTSERGDAPSGTFSLSVFPLADVVRECVELTRIDAGRRHVSLRVEVPGDLEVQADRDGILQVLLNFVSNAIKYNREGGSVVIQAASRPRGVRVSIRDTGIGMTAGEKERIFERYFRTGEARRADSGTGIGLSIVQGILRKHGTLIRVESVPGKGSTFSFTLPAPRDLAEGDGED